MEEILKNANEFLESAEDNVKKERWNAAVSDFFKSIVTFCDYLLYREIKIIPKNHNERFDLLKTHFGEIYNKIIDLFKKYRDSYNLRLTKEDATKLKSYAYELKEYILNKK